MLYLVAVCLLSMAAYGSERSEQRWLYQRSDGEWFKCRGEVCDQSIPPPAWAPLPERQTPTDATPLQGHEWRTDVHFQCPNLGADRKTSARCDTSQFDPLQKLNKRIVWKLVAVLRAPGEIGHARLDTLFVLGNV